MIRATVAVRTLPPLLLACATLAQSTERVSLGAGGAQITTGVAWPAMSGNGRYIAFTTPAANVVPGDTNNRNDVFVRDLATGVVGASVVFARRPQGHAANRALFHGSIVDLGVHPRQLHARLARV